MCFCSWCGADKAVKVPIRLADGPSLSEGRVEVFLRGEWGTVCDDEWDDLDALVVCRQLNYSDGLTVHYGPGSGRIWLDNVQCSGDELALAHCPTGASIGTHNCVHNEDVAVRCSGGFARQLDACTASKRPEIGANSHFEHVQNDIPLTFPQCAVNYMGIRHIQNLEIMLATGIGRRQICMNCGKE